MPIAVKRVYEKPARADGVRVLVDRLRPRGVRKADAAIDHWLRDLAPSDDLRKWFHGNPAASWTTFRKRYLKELSQPEAAAALEQLSKLAASHKQVTLLFASKNEEQNNATVLRDVLEGMRKPPTGTGPMAAQVRIRKAARRPG
jgi:uncharacterized protein YeaO (DUF488 family)